MSRQSWASVLIVRSVAFIAFMAATCSAETEKDIFPATIFTLFTLFTYTYTIFNENLWNAMILEKYGP